MVDCRAAEQTYFDKRLTKLCSQGSNWHFEGLAQDCGNSIADALELPFLTHWSYRSLALSYWVCLLKLGAWIKALDKFHKHDSSSSNTHMCIMAEYITAQSFAPRILSQYLCQETSNFVHQYLFSEISAFPYQHLLRLTDWIDFNSLPLGICFWF